MFSVAGHETTAMSLTFSMPYIAGDSDLQEWVREEVDWVSNEDKLERYADAFPELKRCSAFLVRR